MENPSTTNLFKFMSVRSVIKPTIVPNDISYVRDKRMNGGVSLIDVHPSDSIGTKLMNEIFGYIMVFYDETDKTSAQKKEDINALLNTFETSLGMSVTEYTVPDKAFIDDLILVINKYLVNYNRCSLIKDIECVIKTHSNNEITSLRHFMYNGSPTRFHQVQSNLFNWLYIQYIYKRKYPFNLEYVLSGIRALNVIYWLNHDNEIEPCSNYLQNANGCLPFFVNLFAKKNNSNVPGHNPPKSNKYGCVYKSPETTVLNTAADLNTAFNATVAISPVLSGLCFYKSPFNAIKRVGMGDLKIVKEKLCKYEAGEIAHIENVLRGESKERIHRRLDRLEDIFTKETEEIQENTRDTQTTDRYEVKKEIDSVINEELQVNANASGSVSGSYGVVKYNASASAGFAYSRSATDAARSANNYVKEIVDKSVTRVQHKINEARTTKKLNEVEETNKHAINNENNTSHVTGIYRYVDKHFKSQLFNYGKRVMFEFIIPEPAFFFKSVFEKLKTTPENIGTAPVAPEFPQIAINAIDQSTVDVWSAKYNLTNLKPEPADDLRLNEAFTNLNLPESSAYEEAIQIPEGYFAVSSGANGSYITNDNKNCFFQINIGNSSWGEMKTNTDTTPPNKLWSFLKSLSFNSNIQGKVLVSILTNDIASYAINVTIVCHLSDEKKREWQIDTYNKIMDAYDNKYKDYENKLAQYNNRKESADAQNTMQIKGQNPLFNQEIIKAEFKKHCITMITKDYDTDADEDFVSTSHAIGSRSVGSGNTSSSIPAINLTETNKISPFIQFIEQAFDWNNLTYLLYSYMWHTENKWYDTFKTYEETDPLFGAFLRAGSARVLLPVFPVYETAVMQFLYTKEIWNGGEAPAIDDELYISIHDEIRNQQDELNNATPERDKDGKLISWEYTVPTPLIYLQSSSELPTFNCTMQ